MTVISYGYSQNSTGSSFQYNSTSSYTVLYSPKTGASDFKVNFTTYSSPSKTGIVWMDPNGTVIAAYMSGQNTTGSAALVVVGQLSSAFPDEYFYGANLQAYLAVPGVHQINQSSLTLGSTTMTITNYGISSPSSFCNGSGILMDSQFNLQAGTVSGTTMTLVPLWSETGSFSPLKGSGILTYASVVKILSVTP
jgi:hypothetical protein